MSPYENCLTMEGIMLEGFEREFGWPFVGDTLAGDSSIAMQSMDDPQ